MPRVDWTLNASPFYYSPPEAYADYSFIDTEQDAGIYEDSHSPGGEIDRPGGGAHAPGRDLQYQPAGRPQ